MSSGEVLNIFPTRANYVQVKNRMVLIEKGYSLLRRKRDALEMKIRENTFSLNILRKSSTDAVRDAIFSMARLNYLGVDLTHVPLVEYSIPDIYLKINYLKLIGVTVPNFKICIRDTNSGDFTGLARGGLEVVEARKKFRFALEQLTNYASVEYTVKTLLEGQRVNNMRLNGMEFVLLPRYHNTLKYIVEELDDLERQDFYRLKRTRAMRMEKEKEDILDMLQKRNDPEKHARKEVELIKSRRNTVHFKTIVTPKINVNIDRVIITKSRLIPKDSDLDKILEVPENIETESDWLSDLEELEVERDEENADDEDSDSRNFSKVISILENVSDVEEGDQGQNPRSSQM